MKKILFLSLSAFSLLSATVLEDAKRISEIQGAVRLGFINQQNPSDLDTYTTAMGLRLNYATPQWNNIKLGISAFATQKIHPLTGDNEKANPDFLDAEDQSYIYMGEAYVDYAVNDFSLRIGRQLIDTPFADTDDIRMHPNSFEAAVATYGGFENTILTSGYLTRWAGVDSGEDRSEFKKLSDQSDGAAFVGFTNESITHLALQGWVYRIDDLATAYYADAVYAPVLSGSAETEMSFQYARFDEEKGSQSVQSGADGSVYGAAISVNIGAVRVEAGYNTAENKGGKGVINGFGGGPYCTSMEEMTIDGMEDAKGYRGSITYDLALLGSEGLSVNVAIGRFKSAPLDANVREFDIIATYDITQAIFADVSYAKVDDRNNNFNGGSDGGFSRLLARVNYTF